MADPVATDAPTNSSATTTAPEPGEKPFQKQQGADRPTEAPDSTEASAIAREKKKTSESAMGSGAGSSSKQESSEGGAGSTGGGGSEDKGTGQKHAKSTGLQADGGNFDATAPGAGREADRLLEEKGVHLEGNTGPPQETSDPSASSGDKPSVGQKVKDALHIGKH